MNDNATDTFDKELKEALKEGGAFFAEIEGSPPRAQIALACALFEEWLGRELSKKFTNSLKDCTDLSEKEQKELQNTVPQGALAKVRLACALGILPYKALPDFKKALKTRNAALHQAKLLTTLQEQEIADTVEFFLGWAVSYEPGDEEYPEFD